LQFFINTAGVAVKEEEIVAMEKKEYVYTK
jgi:hypothetical protein